MKNKAEDIKRKLTDQEFELNILRKVGKTLTSELDTDVILSRIIDACRELISAEAWSILLIDRESQDLIFSAILGGKSKELEQTAIKLGQGIAGAVARSGKARIVNNVEQDPDFYNMIDKSTGFSTKSILCAPLISRGKTLGVIEIINKKKGKDFTKKDLEKVENFTKFASIVLENAQLYDQALHSSITDDLTGLYNGRFINRKLSIELEVAKQKKQPLSFVFIDLDRFKNVNDHYGHIIGSQTLRAVGKWLSEKLTTETEIIARYGGDEFLFVLVGKRVDDAKMLAENLRSELSDKVFEFNNGVRVNITASFGISAYPEIADTLEDLIGMADKAMYEVKEATRNGVRVFKPDKSVGNEKKA